MPRLVISIAELDPSHVTQLEYALAFASENILSYAINRANRTVELEVKSEESSAEAALKVQELVKRYGRAEFGLAGGVHFQQDRELPIIDAWQGLLDRKWVIPVGEGHVVLRGLAAALLEMVDNKIDSMFARAFGAEREFYPSTILCATLDRTNHFTSFPEHIDFVAHLKPDLAAINSFGQLCRAEGWSVAAHHGRMANHDFAIAPSCCYHCYEAMEGWQVEPPGRSITALLNCHRYEGANHRSLSRLRAFTMREVVWVGQPRYVLECRAKAEELIVQWAREWEFVGTLETANDCFFTEDYAVKASFQRQQQAKKELRLRIPAENLSLSVFSSNFHSTTFGKAFNIKTGERSATSGCVGWGYERWIYAIFSQFGFDPGTWPVKLRADFESYKRAKV